MKILFICRGNVGRSQIAELLPEYLAQSVKLIRWNVADPKGKDIEFTRNIRQQIKNLIDSIE